MTLELSVSTAVLAQLLAMHVALACSMAALASVPLLLLLLLPHAASLHGTHAPAQVQMLV